MPVIEISSLTHPGVEIFSTLTEAQLRNRLEPDKGLFIAESPKVIKVALDAGYEPLALLCEYKHIYGDAAEIIERCGDIPVYTSGRELLAELTGYVLTRGVLCAMRRPVPKSMEDVCRGARRIVVIDGVVDTTNIGAIFRSAAALGMDAVLLTRNSCDPLNRRAVRVSMGTVFLVPWTWMDGPLDTLGELGFRTAAMALTDNSISIDNPVLKTEPRLAIVMWGVTINVYNWGEYIANGTDDSLEVNAEFTRRTGIQVNYTTFDSNEALYSKLAGGGADYDVIIPSDYMEIGRAHV